MLLALLLLLIVLVTVGCIIGAVLHKRDSDRHSDTETNNLPSASVSDTQAPLGEQPAPSPDSGKTVIVIDPGHGFKDTGTESEHLLPLSEKDVNLAVSLKLRDLLISEGYEVVMLRDSDTPPASWSYGDDLSPEERVDFLSRIAGADYFLSLHCNSYTGSGRANGTRIYYYKDNDAQTPALAESISDGIADQISGASPSLHAYKAAQAFTVTKHQICPALLIEIGFVTDEEDAANMKNDAWQTSFARGVADGISDHIRLQSTADT